MPHLDDLSVEQVASEQLHFPGLFIQLVVGPLDRLHPQLPLQEGLLFVNIPSLGLNQILLLFLPILLNKQESAPRGDSFRKIRFPGGSLARSLSETTQKTESQEFSTGPKRCQHR